MLRAPVCWRAWRNSSGALRSWTSWKEPSSPGIRNSFRSMAARRVGKSELILKFMTGKPGIYYLGQQSPAALQVHGFLQEAAAGLHMPLLAELRVTDWQAALLTVVEQWSAARPRNQAGSGAGRVPVDCGFESGHSRDPATVLGPALERRRQRDAAVVRLVPGFHGTGGVGVRQARCSGAARRRFTCNRSVTWRPPGSTHAGR